MMNTGKLAGRTVLITGGSRGIGKAIAIKLAKDGANVVVAAKTAEPHPKLPGTIYTACEEIEKAGGKGLACIVDVRDENAVKRAVEDTVKKFGGIDIVINNASAISLTGTADTPMSRYDLMHNINTRGTFLVTKECLPYLKKSDHAHVLNISPPLNMKPIWFQKHVAYTMAKYGMSMCVLGMHEEFRPYNIAVNALWPRTAIDTAAMQMLGGKESANISRKPDIMADAAYSILIKDPKTFTGHFCIDEDIVKQAGATEADIINYACNPDNAENLMDDFFLDPKETQKEKTATSVEAPKGKIASLFKKIESTLSPQTVEKVQAIYVFNVTGEEAGLWYLDLKNGNGACGFGEYAHKPDATLSMDSKHFFDMFTGKTKPTTAYMTGKMKIKGDLTKAIKLESLMGSLRAKL